MTTKTKRTVLGQLLKWMMERNFNLQELVIEGLTGHDFVIGTPLEDGTGAQKKVADLVTDVNAILLTDIGTLATGSTKKGLCLVRGPAIISSSYIAAGNGITAAAVVTQLQTAPTQIGSESSVLVVDEPTYS